MAIGAFIAGRYTGTHGGSSLGITEQGYTLGFSAQYEEIGESDAWGQSLIALIFRGLRVNLTLNSLEYTAAGIAGAVWPFGSLGATGVIGREAINSSLVAQVVLTATASTPAASSPATLTATRCIVNGNSIDLLFNSKLRRVPFGYHMLISDSGVFFTTS